VSTQAEVTDELAGLHPDFDEAAPFTIVVKDNPAEGVAFVLHEIGPTTLVAIQPDTRAIDGHWLDGTCVDQAAAWAESRNKAGYNLYYTLNLPRHGTSKKPAKAGIKAVRGFCADVDAKDGRTMDQCLASIAALPLRPSFIIMSGGGFQPVWLLDRLVPVVDETVCQWAEEIGKRIVEITHSDAVQNVDRILRMPFTVNYPNKTKRCAGRTVCLSGVLAGHDQ
jgi:hypothetical protein